MHGMNSEFLPPLTFEGRQLGLFLEIKPSYIVESTGSNVSLQVMNSEAFPCGCVLKRILGEGMDLIPCDRHKKDYEETYGLVKGQN